MNFQSFDIQKLEKEQKWNELLNILNTFDGKKNLQFYLKKANTLSKLHQNDKALELFYNITKEYPLNEWAYFYVLQLLLKMKKYKEAYSFFKKNTKIFLSNPRVLNYFQSSDDLINFVLINEKVSLECFLNCMPIIHKLETRDKIPVKNIFLKNELCGFKYTEKQIITILNSLDYLSFSDTNLSSFFENINIPKLLKEYPFIVSKTVKNMVSIYIKKKSFNLISFYYTVILKISEQRDNAKYFLMQNYEQFTYNDSCYLHQDIILFFEKDILYEILNEVFSQKNFTYTIENLYTYLILNYIDNKKLEIKQLYRFFVEHYNDILISTHITNFYCSDKIYERKFLNRQINTNKKKKVHTWEDIGFKLPMSAEHAYRVFSGFFLEEYKNAINELGFKKLREMYYPIFTYMEDMQKAVTHEKLSTVYNTNYIVVEDDKAEEYKAYSNSDKMYYKMHACYQMAMETNDYDFIIRLRPDKQLYKKNNFNIDKLLSEIEKERKIYVDYPIKLHHKLKLIIGDQFAIGTKECMDIYHSVWETKELFSEIGLEGGEPLKPHSPIANRLMLSGIKTQTLDSIRCGDFETLCLDGKKIYDLLGDLLKSRNNKYDKLFLEAINKDLKIKEVVK